MQQSESHPYQTRSTTAASQATETHNRGGAASSSGSGTHLAADVHLAVYTIPDKTCLTAADWANIPPNVCQQILSIDSEVYRLGGQVCKEWNQIQRSDNCRVINMRLFADFEWLDTENRNETNTYSGFAAYTVLQQHAAKDLQQLSWNFEDDAPVAPMSNVELINQFSNLTHLHLYDVELDWQSLQLSAPHLVDLRLGAYCLWAGYTTYHEAHEDHKPVYSLAFVNRHPMLQVLEVAVDSDYGESLVIFGDLVLPHLQTLYLHGPDVYHHGPEGYAVLREISLKNIPTGCSIDIRRFNLKQESAQNRMLH